MPKTIEVIGCLKMSAPLMEYLNSVIKQKVFFNNQDVRPDKILYVSIIVVSTLNKQTTPIVR